MFQQEKHPDIEAGVSKGHSSDRRSQYLPGSGWVLNADVVLWPGCTVW